jgi:hypothetical protein
MNCKSIWFLFAFCLFRFTVGIANPVLQQRIDSISLLDSELKEIQIVHKSLVQVLTSYIGENKDELHPNSHTIILLEYIQKDNSQFFHIGIKILYRESFITYKPQFYTTINDCVVLVHSLPNLYFHTVSNKVVTLEALCKDKIINDILPNGEKNIVYNESRTKYKLNFPLITLETVNWKINFRSGTMSYTNMLPIFNGND